MATHRTRPRSVTETLFTREELNKSVAFAKREEQVLIAEFITQRAGEMIGKADFHPQASAMALAKAIEQGEYRS